MAQFLIIICLAPQHLPMLHARTSYNASCSARVPTLSP